jgi:mRNA interferase MazF
MATLPAASPKRGEIWLISFDPSAGAEIQKLRPALVISLDSIGRLPLRIVVPITDWQPKFSSLPWFVEMEPDATNGLVKPSGADSFQTKSVSLVRFRQRIGMATAAQVDAVASAVALCVGAP